MTHLATLPLLPLAALAALSLAACNGGNSAPCFFAFFR